MTAVASHASAFVSIGLLAHNEARTIGPTLESLFRQTFFAELRTRGWLAEVRCVVNGSTDATAAVAERILAQKSATHPHRFVFQACVDVLEEAGKINAWNQYVHRFSAPDARYLILMDADIVFGHTTTLWNLCQALEQNDAAVVATGQPLKNLNLKRSATLRERLSLATSRLTQGSAGQITGQLYCIRAATARRIRLPRDLAACEDGFIKSVVCTDFLTRPPQHTRIVRAPDASHIYVGYIHPGDILRNQKRQMIGQTFVHVLVDRFLPVLSTAARQNLNRTVARLEAENPRWLRQLMAAHLRRHCHFWQLFPGMLTFRFRRLAGMAVRDRFRFLPATLAGFAVTLVAGWMAARALHRGEIRYWPGKTDHQSAAAGEPLGPTCAG